MLPSDAVARFLRKAKIERGLSANTLAAYQRDLDLYGSVLASRGVDNVAAISAADVTAFHVTLNERGFAASSIARMLSSVRALHKFLLEEGATATDVARDHRPPKQAQRLPKAISIAEMQRLLETADHVDATPVQLRDRAIAELLYASGARISEVVGLDVDDVTDEFVLVRGKGSKQRLVPVGSHARAALDAYLVRGRPLLAASGRSKAALFVGARGARLSRQSVWLILQALAETAKVPHVSPHTFRHSFATHLLEGGADVRVVQELLGHSSVATTQIYTQVTADTLRDMYTSAHPRAR